MNPELNTISLHQMIVRHREGDRRALDELIRRTGQRLERLARKMLGTFPAVRAREQTVDVLQSALIRLTRALGEATPESVRDFYRLAAEQIRRELLDLTRRYARRPEETLIDENAAELVEVEATDMTKWAALQEAAGELPSDLREVFGLRFYHGWTPAQISQLLQISDRQVRRRFTEACRCLRRAVGGELPGP
jgi:RNA polymerase sigma-70 factor (ECF subfamily)